MAKSVGQKISKEDAELAETAKQMAGGPAALARMFGVTLPAASEWGRTRPIPRHVRPRLEEYVKPGRPAAATATEDREVSSGQIGALPAVRDLVRLFEPARLADLPRQSRKQYGQRVHELIVWVKRELEEYQKVLEAEHRRKPIKRRASAKGKEL